jgi:hypothetical protein
VTEAAGEYLEQLAERWARLARSTTSEERVRVIVDGLAEVMAASHALTEVGLGDPQAAEQAVRRLEGLAGRQLVVSRHRDGIRGAWWGVRHNPSHPLRRRLGEMFDRLRDIWDHLRGDETPVLEGVVPGPFPAGHSDVAVISVERWSDGVTIHSAAPPPERDGGGEPRWASRLEDDAGTAYSPTEGGGGGGDRLIRTRSSFAPSIRRETRTLRITVMSSRIEVDLAETVWDPP